jgi:hypothetical protein
MFDNRQSICYVQYHVSWYNTTKANQHQQISLELQVYRIYMDFIIYCINVKNSKAD